MSVPKYKLSSIRASYNKTVALDIDELTIEASGLFVLVGANGSGKSTLLNILAFLNKPNQGTISFDGSPVNWTLKQCASLRKRVTLLHQQPYLFAGSVASNVAFGLVARGADKKYTQKVVSESLHKVGLAGFESRTARKLSGGECRRVALARALACKSEVLLLDEPIAHVDRASSALIEALVVSLAGDGITVVMSSHDERLGVRLGAHMIHLSDGKLDEAPGPLASPDFPGCEKERNAKF